MVKKVKPAKPEMWKVKELIDASHTKPARGRQLTIPGFQRRLAWSDEKREKLIRSIKNGYPFGSLLVFKDKVASNSSSSSGIQKDYYKLIDGLQRTQSLKFYDTNKNRFFRSDEVKDDDVTFIANRLNRTSMKDRLLIRDTLVGWVQGTSGFSPTDGWETSELVKALVTYVLGFNEKSTEYNHNRSRLLDDREFIDRLRLFLEAVSDSADIDDIEIPVIVFEGRSDDLEEIFKLLNTEGTPLTKYEIFAAEWMDYTDRIERKEIRDAIWKKYEMLAAEGFTLDVADQAPTESSRRVRQYNLFEFLFGFGQCLPVRFERLFKGTKADKPNPVAFNLVCACFGIHVSKMEELPETIKHLDRSKLQECIEDSIRCVDVALDPVLSVKEAGKETLPIYHKEYQIISAIASAFQAKYSIRDLSVLASSSRNIATFSKHVLMHYLYELLVGNWSGSGDSTLHDTVNSKRYLMSAPSKEMWENAFDVWFSKHTREYRHKGRLIRQDSEAILLLKYIYAHRLTLFENARTYHVE
ncbi:MAG: DUF262 domain-containing protein, partial [Candidatus Poribacteria bacterium]|nr:DUF262 domain-containing protein [Candidatus Poribacteria bacterium]